MLTAFLLTCSLLIGQDDYIVTSTNFHQHNGLSSPHTNDIYQDDIGYIWVANTTGLDRFDGRQTKNWSYEELGINNGSIQWIGKDNAGWIWICIRSSNGQYNFQFLHTTSFEIQSMNERFPEGMPLTLDIKKDGHLTQQIRTLLRIKDKRGRLYFGASNAPVRLINYDGISGFNEIHIPTLSQLVIHSIDDDYRIWGSEHGNIVVLDTLGNILKKFTNDDFNSIRFVEYYKGSVYYMTYLFEDQKNKQYTVMKLDVQSGEKQNIFKDFQFQQKAEIFFNRKYGYIGSLDGLKLHIYDIDEDKLYKNISPSFVVDFDDSFSMLDERGRAWFRSDNYIRMIDVKKRKFNNYLTYSLNEELSQPFNNDARAMVVRDDSLIVNLEFSGLFFNALEDSDYINPDANEPQKYNSKFTDQGYLGRPLGLEKDGSLYIGGHGELIFLSPENQMNKRIDIKLRDQFVDIWSIYKDDKARYWCGTSIGLSMYDDNTGQAYPHVLPSFDSKETFHTYYISPDQSSSHLWLCTDHGLMLFDAEQQKVLKKYSTTQSDEFYMPADYFTHINFDGDSVRWMSTSHGLIRWHLASNEKILFNKSNGLVDDHLYAAYADDHNFLWLPTNQGICRFDRATFEVYNFNLNDGLPQMEFNRVSHYQHDDGVIYYGGLNGVTSFSPNDFLEESFTTRPVLAIQKFNQFVGEKNGLVDMTGELQKSHQILMKPEDSFFELYPALLTFENVELIKYMKKVEGIDEDWVLLPDGHVQQGRLPFGQHTLKLKAISARGVSSANEIHIDILLTRPFYLQAKFIILIILFVTLGAWLFISWRLDRHRRRQRMLEEKVNKATEKIRHDKTLIEEQAEELKRMDVVKSKFFANVSHELRTPLTLMLGPLSSMLKRNNYVESDQNLLKTALRNGKKLNQLISTILDLSKMDSEKLEVHNQPVNVLSFTKKMVAFFDSFAKQNDVQLLFESNVPIDLTVQMDTEKMELVIHNLLSNAVKYSHVGGEVKLKVRDGAEFIQFEVADNGRGIHEKDLPHIFNRYYQSKFGDYKPEGGTGIGLSLVKEMLLLMDGNISCTSKIGEGSKFIAALPKIEVVGHSAVISDVELFHDFQKLPSHSFVQKEHAGFKLLVVEDNMELRQYLASILNADFQVDFAANGSIAWKEKLPFHQYDLILSDIMMPVMDGFELLKLLKTDDRYRHIPIIMLTARAGQDDRLNALRIGVDDYLIKPFDESELLARIQNLLRKMSTPENVKQKIDLDVNQNNTIVRSNAMTEQDVIWLEKLEKMIITNLNDNRFNMTFIAQEMNVSRRYLHRRLKALLNLKPKEYILEIKMHQAKSMLENNEVQTVKELASEIGYNDPAYFSRLYKNRYGKAPSEYITDRQV